MTLVSCRPLGAILLWALLAPCALVAAMAAERDPQAQEAGSYWRLTFSPLAAHYHHEPDHRYVWGYGCGACPACELRARGWERYRLTSPMPLAGYAGPA